VIPQQWLGTEHKMQKLLVAYSIPRKTQS